MGSTRLMWVGLDLVGLDLCDGLGYVEFVTTHHGKLGQKILSTQPMDTFIWYVVHNFNSHDTLPLCVFIS